MKTLFGIVVILALVVAGAWFLSRSEPAAPAPVVMNTYQNQRFGVAFEYPAGYVLSEGQREDGHYAITLVRQEDAVPSENSEGPTAITFDFYAYEGALSEWLATSSSNYQLGDGTYLETTAGAAPAVRYGWSGLYEGETTAVLHEGTVVAISTTYLTPTDAIRSDYEAVLASLTLE